MQGEQNDLEQYRLPGYQNALIDAVTAKNSNTVVLLFTAGGVAMPWHDQASSIVECFYGGEEAPAAIVDVLFGAYSPSGKLPVTYPESIRQLAVDCVQLNYEKSISSIGYRYFDQIDDKPLFPFGHGLSYTTFTYDDLRVNIDREGIVVRATITNTGNRSGSETVQLYVSDPQSSVPRPVRELKGFAKVQLDPGESKPVEFNLLPDDLAYYDIQSKSWRVESGEFILELAASSRDIRLSKSIQWKEEIDDL